MLRSRTPQVPSRGEFDGLCALVWVSLQAGPPLDLKVALKLVAAWLRNRSLSDYQSKDGQATAFDMPEYARLPAERVECYLLDSVLRKHPAFIRLENAGLPAIMTP